MFLFELLAEAVDGHLPKFRELSRFPEVRRDLALLVDQDVPAQDILTNPCGGRRMDDGPQAV